MTYRGHAHPQGTAVLGNASNPSMSTRSTGTNSSWHTAGPLNTPCTHGITGGQGGTAPYPATLPAALALQQQSINMEVMGPGSSSSSSGHSFLHRTPMLPMGLVGRVTEKWVSKSSMHPHSVTQRPWQPGPGQTVFVKAQLCQAAHPCRQGSGTAPAMATKVCSG